MLGAGRDTKKLISTLKEPVSFPVLSIQMAVLYGDAVKNSRLSSSQYGLMDRGSGCRPMVPKLNSGQRHMPGL